MGTFVTFGEIMLRLSPPRQQRFGQCLPGPLQTHFGGAEASVAALLARWGHRAIYLTALPNHPLGHACHANLRSFGIETQHVLMSDRGRMGLYFVEHGVDWRGGQVIYDRAESAFAVTGPGGYDFDAPLSGADWLVVTGISPAVSREAAESTFELLDVASRRGIRIAMDVNFRSKLWRWNPQQSPIELAAETTRRMVDRADLLVCGRSDAVTLLGLPENVAEASLPQQIAERFPQLSLIAVTRRRAVTSTHQQFSAALYDVVSGQHYCGPGDGGCYEIVQVVDRIGSGDAFLGALLAAIEDDGGKDLSLAIEMAAAACCLAHSIEGDFSFFSRDEVRELIEQGAAGRLKR